MIRPWEVESRWRCYWCARCEVAGRDRVYGGYVRCWSCGGPPSRTWMQDSDALARVDWINARR
jgi:hypothetical protein